MRNSFFATALCGLAALHTVGAAPVAVTSNDIVKGKVFDRFITIWLENQVSMAFSMILMFHQHQ